MALPREDEDDTPMDLPPLDRSLDDDEACGLPLEDDSDVTLEPIAPLGRGGEEKGAREDDASWLLGATPESEGEHWLEGSESADELVGQDPLGGGAAEYGWVGDTEPPVHEIFDEGIGITDDGSLLERDGGEEGLGDEPIFGGTQDDEDDVGLPPLLPGDEGEDGFPLEELGEDSILDELRVRDSIQPEEPEPNGAIE